MSSSISLRPPSGFRDFLPAEARLRLRITRQIAQAFESFGFSPLETPALESLDLLLGDAQERGGAENSKLVFQILKRGEKLKSALANPLAEIAEFGLRFDLTLPLARVVAAQRGSLRLPWKVYHIAPVWRAERAQKGRLREFIQCDVDVLGVEGVTAELELIQAVSTALARVGAPRFELRLNDRRILQGLGDRLGLSSQQFGEFAILLDKRDKLNETQWRSELATLIPHPDPVLERVLSHTLSLEEVAQWSAPASLELRRLTADLKELDLHLSQITFDPTLVRGMGYYTGSVFELRHPSEGYSFAGGGRYDRLIGRFCNQPVAACGFSIGFERLALFLSEQEGQSLESGPLRPGLFLPVPTPEARIAIHTLAQSLRAQGHIVDVYPAEAPLKTQLRFAQAETYRWVLLVDLDGSFRLKDFHEGSETPITENELYSSSFAGAPQVSFMHPPG